MTCRYTSSSVHRMWHARPILPTHALVPAFSDTTEFWNWFPRRDCFVYVQFGPVEVLGKASDMIWQGKTADTKPTDLNLIPRIHLVEGQNYIFKLSSEFWTCALMEYTYMQSHYTYIYIQTYTYTAIHIYVEHIHAYIHTCPYIGMYT